MGDKKVDSLILNFGIVWTDHGFFCQLEYVDSESHKILFNDMQERAPSLKHVGTTKEFLGVKKVAFCSTRV
jgi:hypothetical protein